METRKTLLAIAAAALLAVTFACKGTKNAPPDEPVEETADTMTTEYEELADSVVELIAETPMPKAADMLFDDFFFNFAANNKLQLDRIDFPLKVKTESGEEQWSKAQWKPEHFFMDQDYYTLIFDTDRQANAVRDTAIAKTVVEKIFLDTDIIERYIFDRRAGLWKLRAIEYQHIEESDNASFLQFYKKFSTDSAFQAAHLKEPVMFEGPDPDDDFNTMEGVVTIDTWPAFAPEMPTGKIYNIVYGDEKPNTNQRIFIIRGIANGLEQELRFHKEGGRWLLTKLTQ